MTLGKLKLFSFLLERDTVCSADLFYGLVQGTGKRAMVTYPHSLGSWFCLLILFGLCFLESDALYGHVPGPGSIACLCGSVFVDHLHQG